MSDLVTVGVPLYKRLEYLPIVFDNIAAQDYPNIELLVSDNGMNGTTMPDIVRRFYPKPYRFRQNPSTVGMSAHFNQLIQEASGKYIVILGDDDEISPNYVSDLVSLLERHPQASVAMSVQESIDEAGALLGRSKDTVPEILSGPDFIRAAWETGEYGFSSLSTYLAKTARLRAVGGYPIFRAAQYDDDSLIVKACFDNYIAFSIRSVSRKRYHKSSDQNCLPILDLAGSTRDFLRLLETDPIMLGYAASHSAEWSQSKRHLIDMAWKTYFFRWLDMYRPRMSRIRWIMAAFALPFIRDYYRAVALTLSSGAASATLARFKKLFPDTYEACRRIRATIHKPV